MNRSFTLEIEKMVYGGRGMGRVDGKVVFVPFTAPGDRVCVEVVREKKDYIEAVPKRMEQESPLRVRPFCGFFGKCGGCQYQHLSYPHQLKLKEKEIKESLLHRKEDKDFEVLPVFPSPHDRGYRIRAQFKRDLRNQPEVLGFYGMRSHDLVDLRECPLLHPLTNEILKGLKNWLGQRRELPVRGADIQISPDENKGVVRMQVEGGYPSQMAEMAAKEIPGVKGVILDGKKKISWGEVTLLYRCPEISGRRSVQIRADYDSFTQVNPYQNWNLVERVVEWADPSGRENVVDLFCGSGNLTLPLAQRAGKVWGVDQDERAVKNAARNARDNRIENCFFIKATASRGVRRILAEKKSVDVVVLDPPRAGAKEVLEAIARMKPRKIIYVSCEPPTLARDLKRLGEMGFCVKRVQPLDMFPHTYHVEVIAELSAISGRQRQRTN